MITEEFEVDHSSLNVLAHDRPGCISHINLAVDNICESMKKWVEDHVDEVIPDVLDHRWKIKVTIQLEDGV